MTQHVILAVRDRAIDAFGRPFSAPALGQAIRSFGDEVNNPESPMNRHPEDYDLYYLAVFDDNTGRFAAPDEGPRQVAIGKDVFVKPK